MFEVTKIGIGAFWLLPKPQSRTKKFTYRDYIDLIEFGLCKHKEIDLSSFEIYFDESFDSDIYLEPNWKELIDNGEYFPLPAFFRTTFTLTIPTQWQIDNTAQHRHIIESPLEITIHDTFHYPVTFIRSLDFSREDITDGSDCVYVARKYMEYLFANDPHLEFESIGPSPFHADLELDHEAFHSIESIDFECQRKPRRGYDLVAFQYNAAAIGSNDHNAAYQHLVYCLAPQLGLYYHICAARIKTMRAWHDISSNHAALVDLTSEPCSNRIRNIFNTGSLIKKSIIDIVNFEAEYKSTVEYITNEFNDDKNKGVATYLDYFIERKLQELPRYDTSKLYAFADFVEKRHSKWIEVSILGFAGLVGALLGGLLSK